MIDTHHSNPLTVRTDRIDDFKLRLRNNAQFYDTRYLNHIGRRWTSAVIEWMLSIISYDFKHYQ